MQKVCRILNKFRPITAPLSLPRRTPQEIGLFRRPTPKTSHVLPVKEVRFEQPPSLFERPKHPHYDLGKEVTAQVAEMDNLLLSGDTAGASSKCKELLEQHAERITLAKLFENLVYIFAKHNKWSEVNTLWREMCSNGLIPSNKVRTLLIPLLLLLPSVSNTSLTNSQLTLLRKEVAENVYPDEGFICSLIAKMSRNGASPASCEDVLRNYAELRGKKWIPSHIITRTMSSIYIRAGNMKEFIRWTRHSNKLYQEEDESSKTSRLTELASNKLRFDKSDAHRLEEMIERTQSTDTGAYNVLLNSLVHQQDFEATSRVYSNLCTINLPDEQTFKSIFKAYTLQRESPVVKTSKIRISPRPRTLFAQILEVHDHNLAHFHSSPHKIPPLFTHSLLFRILQSYLSLQDYAACLMTLSTFSSHSIHPTTEIHRLIWTSITSRIIKQSIQHKLLRNKAYVKSIRAFSDLSSSSNDSNANTRYSETEEDIEARRRKEKKMVIRQPGANDRERTWAGRMLDEPHRWEETLTVQEIILDGSTSASGRAPRGLILPNHELSKRIEKRLRELILRSLRDSYFKAHATAEGEGEDLPFTSDSESAVELESQVTQALLRRAVVMQRINSLRTAPDDFGEILRREMEKAQLDMTRRTLPTLF